MRFQRQKYDFYLMILTTLILFAIGLVSLYGITLYNFLAVNPDWTRTVEYIQYIDNMNSCLYPFLVLLLISLGLCIPKRLLDQEILMRFSALVLGLTIILTIFSGIERGLGFILFIMIGIQGVVLLLTYRRSKVIKFEKEGYIVRLGSSLLHLGLVILIFNFVALRENQYHISIFWTGTILITAGSLFSFYPGKISSVFHPEV